LKNGSDDNALVKSLQDLIGHLKEKGADNGKLDEFVTSFTGLVKKLKDDEYTRQNIVMEEDVKKFLGLKEFNEVQVLTRKIALYPIAKAHSFHLHQFIKKDRFKISKKRNYNTYSNGVSQEEWDDFQIAVDEYTEIPWEVTFFIKDNEQDFKFIARFLLNEDKICFYFLPDDKKKMHKFNNDFKAYMEKENIYKNKRVDYSSAGLGFLPDSTVTFEDVILSDFIKKEVEENIINIYTNAKVYKKHGIPLKRGVVFSGPPGCGKSLTIGALSNLLKDQITIICVTSKSVSSPRDISNIYEFARALAPSLIVFEDIDLLGGDRAHGEFSPFVGELLNQLDGLVENKQIVTIASTNFPERLDAALKDRPSRFDRNLYFAEPDTDLRKLFLEKYLESHKHNLSDKELKEVATELKGMSGAQINEVVISAVLHALDNKTSKKDDIILRKEDLLAGISKSRSKKYEPTKKSVGF
jgi:SpoVK/Ycf46/Vps4 family AAA+-type ATPase